MKKIFRNLDCDDVIVMSVVAITILLYAISFAATCGIIKLICMCFELRFKLRIAAGIWLVLVLLRSFFRSSGNNK